MATLDHGTVCEVADLALCIDAVRFDGALALYCIAEVSRQNDCLRVP